jgi:micrococcal nuclease
MSHIAEDILKRSTRIFILGIIIFGLSAAYEGFNWDFLAPSANTPVANTVGTYYKVTKVTDGDTLHIEMSGVDEKIRLIGINTPETVDPRTPVQCFGKEASNRMKDLAEGKSVRLEYDDSQSLRDTYGRLLAYVYLEDGQMLNRIMVAEGYAYEYTYLTPYKYQKEFRQLQTLARTSSRGLWAANTCAGSKTVKATP